MKNSLSAINLINQVFIYRGGFWLAMPHLYGHLAALFFGCMFCEYRHSCFSSRQEFQLWSKSPALLPIPACTSLPHKKVRDPPCGCGAASISFLPWASTKLHCQFTSAMWSVNFAAALHLNCVFVFLSLIETALHDCPWSYVLHS